METGRQPGHVNVDVEVPAPILDEGRPADRRARPIDDRGVRVHRSTGSHGSNDDG